MRLNTQGLVIKATDTGESSRVITLLTKDFGVIRAFANGAKKIKSRLNSGTNPLCYSRFSIRRAKDSYVIEEAVPLETFFRLRENIESLALAQYFCELSGEAAPKEDEAGDYLRLVLNAVHMLSKQKRPQNLIKAVVELKLMCFSGYMPELSACELCGQAGGDAFFFDTVNGVFRCESCAGGGEKAGLGILSAMRYICDSEQERLFSFSLPENSLNRLSEITEKYVTSQLHREFRTLKFYKSLF